MSTVKQAPSQELLFISVNRRNMSFTLHATGFRTRFPESFDPAGVSHRVESPECHELVWTTMGHSRRLGDA